MTTMLEKAAAAAWPFLWDATDTATPSHDAARARMRAALQAIREPDPEMVRALYDAGAMNPHNEWESGIDAILNEKPEASK